MKMSVSLLDEDVEFIDDYAGRRGLPSRSSVLHKALDLLRESELEDAYEAAWEEWQSSDDSSLWDTTANDGIGDATR